MIAYLDVSFLPTDLFHYLYFSIYQLVQKYYFFFLLGQYDRLIKEWASSILSYNVIKKYC